MRSQQVLDISAPPPAKHARQLLADAGPPGARVFRCDSFLGSLGANQASTKSFRW